MNALFKAEVGQMVRVTRRPKKVTVFIGKVVEYHPDDHYLVLDEGEGELHEFDLLSVFCTFEIIKEPTAMPIIPAETPIDSSLAKDGRQIITALLQFIGEDPQRPGLAETPDRVIKAWQHWCSGYECDAAHELKTFDDGAELCGDEMVIVRDIELYSHCEHHLAPFFGVAHVAYIPDKRIVGLSKLARVVDIFSRRLQVQERLTNQIANVIHETLEPIGVGVIIEARHMCMCSRGVAKQHSMTITSALRGAIKDKPEARAEFMSLLRR